MLKKLISHTKRIKGKLVDVETIEYWESVTEQSEVENLKEYWSIIREARNKTYSVREVTKINDLNILNVLFAEEVMGWFWSDKPIVFIENFLPGGFLMNEKVKTNLTHYTHKCVPAMLPDFTSSEYTLRIIERLKDGNVKYGLQPIEGGYEVYCEKHRLSIFGKTLGEVMCKLALVTLSDAYLNL